MKNKVYIKNKEIVFNNVSRPILSKFRPIYKIALIVIILYKCSRNQTASLLKLSFFNSLLKSEENMNKIKQELNGWDQQELIRLNIEPSFQKALSYAIAEGFVGMYNEKYKLTNKGAKLGEEIFNCKELFALEKSFIKEIKTKIGEEKVKSFLEMRGYHND